MQDTFIQVFRGAPSLSLALTHGLGLVYDHTLQSTLYVVRRRHEGYGEMYTVESFVYHSFRTKFIDSRHSMTRRPREDTERALKYKKDRKKKKRKRNGKKRMLHISTHSSNCQIVCNNPNFSWLEGRKEGMKKGVALTPVVTRRRKRDDLVKLYIQMPGLLLLCQPLIFSPDIYP